MLRSESALTCNLTKSGGCENPTLGDCYGCKQARGFIMVEAGNRFGAGINLKFKETENLGIVTSIRYTRSDNHEIKTSFSVIRGLALTTTTDMTTGELLSTEEYSKS